MAAVWPAGPELDVGQQSGQSHISWLHRGNTSVRPHSACDVPNDWEVLAQVSQHVMRILLTD